MSEVKSNNQFHTYLVWSIGVIFAITDMLLVYGFTTPIGTSGFEGLVHAMLFIPAFTLLLPIPQSRPHKAPIIINIKLRTIIIFGSLLAMFILLWVLQGWTIWVFERLYQFSRYHDELMQSIVYGLLLFLAAARLWQMLKKPFCNFMERPLLFLVGAMGALFLFTLLLLFLPGSTVGANYTRNYLHETLVNTMLNAASVVTCTGLVTGDLTKNYSFLGQVFVLVFMQVGGLLLPFVSGLAGLMLSRRTGISPVQNQKSNETGKMPVLPNETGKMPVLQSPTNDPAPQPAILPNGGEVAGLLRFLLTWTLVVEMIGAVLLWPLWPSGWSFLHKLWFGVFHSVSAFSNAGFTLLSDNMVGMNNVWLVHWVIAPLVVLGGVGLPVWAGLWGYGKTPKRQNVKTSKEASMLSGESTACGKDAKRDKPIKQAQQAEHAGQAPARHAGFPRMELHSNLVLTMSFSLILAGAGLLYLTESGRDETVRINRGVTFGDKEARENTVRLDNLPARQRLANSLFMSISARSAGFRTVSLREGDLSPAGRMVLGLLMFVGGSPGGSAGGVKTVVLAMLLFAVWQTLRGRPADASPVPGANGEKISTPSSGEPIPPRLLRGTLAVFLPYLWFVILVTMTLLWTEQLGLETVWFEALSACTNSGLSTGLTGQFSLPGKLVLAGAMLVGRVLPLVLVLVLLRREPKEPWAYAGEPVWLE